MNMNARALFSLFFFLFSSNAFLKSAMHAFLSDCMNVPMRSLLHHLEIIRGEAKKKKRQQQLIIMVDGHENKQKLNGIFMLAHLWHLYIFIFAQN